LTTGTADVTGSATNFIKDSSLVANYKIHELKGYSLRMTKGTNEGKTWEIKDNDDTNWIILDSTGSIGVSSSDTFAIFQKCIAKTFTGIESAYRYIRLFIPPQFTPEGYYQIGSAVLGKAISLTKDFAPGYRKDHRYDIQMLRSSGGGLEPIKNADRKRIFQLRWPGSETAREEMIALLDYIEGKNIVLIPDHNTLTDCYLVKLIGPAQQRHRQGNKFDLSLTFEEIL